MLFGDPVEAGEHDGQDDAGVLLDQTHDVLVVPVVQSSLGHLRRHRQANSDDPGRSRRAQTPPTPNLLIGTDLEMWAGDASGDLFEERLLDLHELRWFDDVQDLLQFP